MALRTASTNIGKGLWNGSRRQSVRCLSAVGNAEGRSPGNFSAFASPSALEANLDPTFFKPGCVIFDKDGTLVCFHTMWSPWCTSFAQRVQTVTGLDDISHHVYDVLGYDHREEKIKIGALAENTHPQIKNKIYEMLRHERGFQPSHARDVVDKTWQDTPEDLSIKLTGNLHELFHRLKTAGVKIAICTSDSQAGTHEFLHRQKLQKYIDLVVCGDDPKGRPKPSPHNAFYICDRLKVRPADAIMVGDTPADTLMGQQAELGLTVGVLTGVGDVGDLIDADVIVKDVKDCVDLVLPQGRESNKAHHVTSRGLSKIARGSLLFGGRNSRNGNSAGRRFYSTSSGLKGGYSHIVVGAGSAGCVLSNRLTEDRK